MVRNNATYGQLDRVLTQLGFSMRKTEPRWRYYEHSPSDTVIILADEAAHEVALPSDIVSARLHLVQKGIVDEQGFDQMLARNGA